MQPGIASDVKLIQFVRFCVSEEGIIPDHTSCQNRLGTGWCEHVAHCIGDFDKYLIWVILSDAERRDFPVLLGLRPVENLLIILRAA
jgi:hypothetical protein